MTDAEIDALAREILTQAVKEISDWDSSYFDSINDELNNGDLIVTFAGTGPEEQGSFACEFMPLGTIKNLIKACEAIHDKSLLSLRETLGNHAAVTQYFGPARQTSIQQMAWHATLSLLAFFRLRLGNTIDGAIEDSKFIAESLIAGAVARRLNQLAPNVAIADMRDEIEAAGKRASEIKQAWLRSHIEGLPHVITKTRRGAPIKSQFVRERERAEYKVKVEAAYRRQRAKAGKRPTKTSVAKDLGEGGINPKTFKDSSLQAFRAKLDRLGIDYDAIVLSIESELNNKS